MCPSSCMVERGGGGERWVGKIARGEEGRRGESHFDGRSGRKEGGKAATPGTTAEKKGEEGKGRREEENELDGEEE